MSKKEALAFCLRPLHLHKRAEYNRHESTVRFDMACTDCKSGCFDYSQIQTVTLGMERYAVRQNLILALLAPYQQPIEHHKTGQLFYDAASYSKIKPSYQNN